MSKPAFIPTLPPPESDDSSDLSDHEVEGAIDTVDASQLTDLLARAVSPGEASVGKADARYAIAKQEVRRRKPHLYLRTTLVCPSEPRKILLYRVDWLQPPQS